MGIANNTELKGEIVSAELKKIIPHDLYDDFSALLATVNYMLPSNGIQTEQAIALNLLIHPIVVIRFKKTQDRYLCIGGIRSLLLAKSSLSLDKILSVTLVKCTRYDEIELVVKADILLSPLLMSIRSPATIGAIHQKMCKEEIESLLIKGMHNKSKLAEQMDYAKNTVFPPKSNSSKECGSES